MDKKSPLTTLEVRWFFEGKVDEHQALKKWFEHSAIEVHEFEPRDDIYLLIPRSYDLGIKWREGQLQFKGLVLSEGEQAFNRLHHGKFEHWIKWSYEELPKAYMHFFTQKQQSGIITISVKKTRALRKIQVTEKPNEVHPTLNVDRAIEIELTDLKVADKQFCTLGFEAYPDDPSMNTAFRPTVESFLNDLKEIQLSVAQSQSYPAWLNSLL